MGLFTIPIRPRWLLRHDWFAIILLIMKMMSWSPWKRLNQGINETTGQIEKSYLPISLPSQPLCQPSSSLTLDKGRKSECPTGACHFPQHQPVRCLLPPHVTIHTHCSSATNKPPWCHISTSESLEQPSEFAGPLKSSCYQSRWINATQIVKISKVNTQLGYLRQKRNSGPPEWYTSKPVPASAFEPSMKNIDLESNPDSRRCRCHQPRHRHLVKVTQQKSVPTPPHRGELVPNCNSQPCQTPELSL
jgi:hypothetical protein